MQIQSCVLTLRCAAVPGAAGDAGELDAQLGPQRRPAQLRLPFEPPSGSSTLPGQSSFLHTAPDARHAICTIAKEPLVTAICIPRKLPRAAISHSQSHVGLIT